MNTSSGFLELMLESKSMLIGLGLVLLVTLGALGAPFLATHNPVQQDFSVTGQPPSPQHIMGTDVFGRDVFSRVLYGGRVSLGVGFAATTLAAVIGIIVGTLAGTLQGWVDWLLMRLVDVLMGFPRLFIILLAVGFTAPGIGLTLLILGGLSWMEVARIVRGEVIVVREMLYVKSAQALGLSNTRIIWRYVIPNIAGSIIVTTALLAGTLILIEAGLSFLGLGVQPPDASWGTILNQGRSDPAGSWWLLVFPGLAVVITVLGFNLLGDGLRDILDPTGRP